LLALTRRNLSEDNIHILVTIRSGITDIERNLKADGSLEVRSNENDVRLYLQQSLRDTDYLSEWISANPKLELSIIEAILPRLAGMFLLARLYVDFLAQIPTQRGVRKALGSLPEGIDDTYADAWERVCAQKPVQADLGKKVISWVTCATRPLRVTELRHALAIEEGDSELDAEGLLDINSLTSFCAGLVVIDAQNNRLSLVHPTANEYFVERQRDLLPTAHDLIATACTTYLLMNVFRGACLEPDDFNRRYGQNKLLGYAAVNWGSHVRSSNSKTSLDLARRLLQNDEARGAAVQALVLNTLGASERFPEWPLLSSAETKRVSDFYRYDFEDSTRPIEAIHLTAFYGLTELTDNLIETKHSIDERDGMGATAVHWAILGGQSAMLDHLLQRGANVQVHRQPYHLRRWSTSCCNVGPNPDLTYPLHMAAALGDTVAIELLISHDADIHRLSKPLSDRIIYGSSYITALTVALENNQDLAAELLRARGANVNDDHWLFFYTAQHGSSDALRTLIASGADRRNLEEAFRGAIYMCRYDMLVMLLDAGVDVNDKSAIGFTAREDSETFLEKEEPIQDSQGVLSGEDSMRRPRECTEGNPRDDIPEKTPLIIVVAAGYGKEAMKCVALLLRSGADTNRIGTRHYEYADDWTWSSFNDKISKSMPSGRKTSAVHTAAYYRNLDMVQFLVDNGANVNLIIHDRYTALTSALHSEGYDCEVRFISLGLEGAPNKIAELTRFREEVLEEGFRFQLKQLLFASERL